MPSVVSGLAARTCPRSASMGRRPSRRPASRGSTVRRARGHRLAQCADQILAAVRDMGGADQIRSSGPTVPTLIRVPRGNVGEGAAIPQFVPRPGASAARASGDPSITTSAPAAIALASPPPRRMPPSATTGTYRPVSLRYASRAAATSLMAVTCGTPMPRTSRVVHAAPGPTPTKTAAAPAPSTRMRRRRWSCCRPRPGSA